MRSKPIKLILIGIFSFIAFAINAFAAITISPTGLSYTVSSDFGDTTLTRTIKTFKTIENDSAFHVLPDKLMPGDAGAATLYDCENGGYASAAEIAIIQNGKKDGYNDMEIQIALYCQATTGTAVKSDDEFYQTICSRYAAGEDVIGTGLFQVSDPSGYFLKGLELYASGSSTTYYESTTGYTGVNLSFDCSSGLCYYPEKDEKAALSSIEGLNIPSNAKILSVTAEGADSIDVTYGSRTLDTVYFNVVATPKTSICPTCAYVQVIVEYESPDVVAQPSLCAPTAPAGSGINILDSSNMLVYSTTGSVSKIFTIYSGTGNTTNNSNTYNSVFYPNSVIVDYENNDVVLANTITTIPASKTTCGIVSIAPGGSLKASSNNTISDDDEEPFKDISTDWSKVTTGTACDGSSYKVTADELSGNVDTIINNQYCNIYCKEDIKIVIPSKAKAASGNSEIFSGRYFTLPDLKAEGRKTCVADIDIEQFFYDVYGDKYDIGDILSGKASTKELLTSGDGSNWDYYNSQNWIEVLSKSYAGITTIVDTNKEVCCSVYLRVSCAGKETIETCPGGRSRVGESSCCYIYTGVPYSCVPVETSTRDCGYGFFKVIKKVCYPIKYVLVSNGNYTDADVVTIKEIDIDGNEVSTDIYSAYNFLGASFVRYKVFPSFRGSDNTKIEFIKKDTGVIKEDTKATCENTPIPTKYGDCENLICTCSIQNEAEWLSACGIQTSSGVGSVGTAVKHQISVYEAIRDANYAATLKSIEDILACSEAYKYIIYNIETPEVTFNYCEDYKIDYKFNGGVNENVTVEYCKDGASTIDFDCLGGSQVTEGPIDEIDFSIFNREISYYSCGDSYCNSSTIKTITIPINKAVKFEYTASFRANTDTVYYAMVPSGVVRTNPTSTNSILLGNDGKVYPLSLGNVGNKACDYSFTFNTIGETHYENCFPELEKPMVCAFVLYNQIVNPGPGNGDSSVGLMYFYRPIDLNDMFPNSNDDFSSKTLPKYRVLGSNWSSEKGIDAQEDIESLGEDAYLEENLEYSYTLTPRQMARIRAYNNAQEKRSNGYADFNLTCDSKGQNCRSGFLDGTMLGCENGKCFKDNLSANPESRDVTFKTYSDGTSWK